MADKTDFSQTSYTLGILSIVFGILSPIAGIALGIIGLVQSKKQKTPVSSKAKNLNILGIIIGTLVLVISIVVFLTVGKNLPSLP